MFSLTTYANEFDGKAMIPNSAT